MYTQRKRLQKLISTQNTPVQDKTQESKEVTTQNTLVQDKTLKVKKKRDGVIMKRFFFPSVSLS